MHTYYEVLELFNELKFYKNDANDGDQEEYIKEYDDGEYMSAIHEDDDEGILIYVNKKGRDITKTFDSSSSFYDFLTE